MGFGGAYQQPERPRPGFWSTRTRPKGTSTRATYKQKMAEIQSAMEPVTDKVEGQLTRLLGDQTSGFTLKSVEATAGTPDGTSYYITIETPAGTTLYIQAKDGLA